MKKRIEQKIKRDDKTNSSLNKIKSEKKKRNRNIDKTNHLKFELVKNKYSDEPYKLENALKELNKIEAIDKNLHEVKYELLLDYIDEFEMVGRLKLADHIRDIHVRFRNINDYGVYINKIDQDYESDDAIFNGYIYKINTPQFNSVNRSHYGNGCDFKHEVIEYRSNHCFIPTKGYCFGKEVNFLTGDDIKEQYLKFIRNEKR